MDPLDRIRQHIESGDREQATRHLGMILNADPRNESAWRLLATLLDDPARQADCYRQILRINPSDVQAAGRLRELSQAPFPPEGDSQPGPDQVAKLRCRQCGGDMEVRFVGRLRDKRAVCLHCGTEFDLPDSYQRVERRRRQDRRPWGSRVTDEVTVETRVDAVTDDASGKLPPELKEASELLRRGEPIDDAAMQRLRDQGYEVELPENPASESFIIKKPLSGQLEADVFTSVNIESKIPQLGPLRPEDVVARAGGALPPERRCNCPACGAVVSVDATRCPWCGAATADGGGS